jgi:hypothetical protein
MLSLAVRAVVVISSCRLRRELINVTVAHPRLFYEYRSEIGVGRDGLCRLAYALCGGRCPFCSGT